MKHESLQRDLLKNIFTNRPSPFTLRMAPMIDVTFLLLLFFLVAAKWRPKEDFFPLQLPSAQAQQYSIAKPEPLIIYIFTTPTGCNVQIGTSHTIQIENKTIEANLAALVEKLQQRLAEQKRFTSDPIEIVCDTGVKWQHLAKIYNIFYGMGLTDITFAMTE